MAFLAGLGGLVSKGAKAYGGMIKDQAKKKLASPSQLTPTDPTNKKKKLGAALQGSKINPREAAKLGTMN